MSFISPVGSQHDPLPSPAVASRVHADGSDAPGVASVAHAPSAVAVSFAGVTKRYGDVEALCGIDLSIRAGATVALLGPNGAGKSTAIGIMLGLLDATSGSAATLGMEPARAVASGRVGAMLQASGVPPRVTVAELVEFARRLYPRPFRTAAALELAGLAPLARRLTGTLSGGETQRLRFAIAIVGDPDLVFLDEPTVGMDVETRRAFWGSMRRFAGTGRTVLFATHYLEEADQAADRIVVLDHGRIVADGTPASIKAGTSGRHVRFTLRDAAEETLVALPGVTGCIVHGEDVTLLTADADATVRALHQSGLSFHDLEVTGADLESAFLALTSDGPAR